MHWRNSRFQIRHFIVGRCHTADEAYRVSLELREEREKALEHARVGIRKAALREAWLRRLAWLPALGAWARVELDKMAAEQPRLQNLLDACAAEIASIDECIALIRPHRQLAHLPDAQAHQAAQEAEWLAELKWRAENYLLAGAGIPHDQIAAMRLHPGFAAEIWPHITRIRASLDKGLQLPVRTGVAALLEDKAK